MSWRIFSDHPASVGETYGQHCLCALTFGFKMLRGAFACIVHAFFPFLFTHTGSKTIHELHDRMVIRRKRTTAQQAKPSSYPSHYKAKSHHSLKI